MGETVFVNAEHNLFQDAFWDKLVRLIVGELKSHFQDRLVSTYVTGSVHRKEAISPQTVGSDLDLAVIITDSFNDEDKVWRAQVNDRLHEQVPGLPWSTMPRAFPVSMLQNVSETEQQEDIISRAVDLEIAGYDLNLDMMSALTRRACYYQFKYDATLVFGRDLVEGIYAPNPDCLWAKMQFQQAWDLVRHTAGLKPTVVAKHTDTNISEWPLPELPNMKLRKLARLGVLGAAYLVMACDDFTSYRGTVVLPATKLMLPEWQSFLELTETFYGSLPTEGESSIKEYLPSLVSWMDMIGAKLSTRAC